MNEEQYEHRLTELEQRSEYYGHRMDQIEVRQDKLDKLVSSVQKLADRQESVERDVKEIKADVRTLLTKPGKRWDAIVDKLIWALLAAVLGFLAARLGLS
jgi:DNA repair exonuclease SbcCD ATPase subunit